MFKVLKILFSNKTFSKVFGLIVIFNVFLIAILQQDLTVVQKLITISPLGIFTLYTLYDIVDEFINHSITIYKDIDDSQNSQMKLENRLLNVMDEIYDDYKENDMKTETGQVVNYEDINLSVLMAYHKLEKFNPKEAPNDFDIDPIKEEARRYLNGSIENTVSNKYDNKHDILDDKGQVKYHEDFDY